VMVSCSNLRRRSTDLKRDRASFYHESLGERKGYAFAGVHIGVELLTPEVVCVEVAWTRPFSLASIDHRLGWP